MARRAQPLQFPNLRKEFDGLLNNARKRVQTIIPIHHRSSSTTRIQTIVPDDRFAALSFGRFWRWTSRLLRGKSLGNDSVISDLNKSTTEEQKRLLLASMPEPDVKAGKVKKIDSDKVIYRGKEMTREEALKSIKKRLLKLRRSVGIDTYQELDEELDPSACLQMQSETRERRPKLIDGLTVMTTGRCDKGLWKGQHFKFCVCARKSKLQTKMRTWRFSKMLPTAMSPEFMADLFTNAGEMELSFLVVPTKNVTIDKIKEGCFHDLSKSFRKRKHRKSSPIASSEEQKAVQALNELFDARRLSQYGFMNGSKIKDDTFFMFAVKTDGSLGIEVSRPKSRQGTEHIKIGSIEQSVVTDTLINNFVGMNPIDNSARMGFVLNTIRLARNRLSWQQQKLLSIYWEDAAEVEAIHDLNRLCRLYTYLSKEREPSPLTGAEPNETSEKRDNDIDLL